MIEKPALCCLAHMFSRAVIFFCYFCPRLRRRLLKKTFIRTLCDGSLSRPLPSISHLREVPVFGNKSLFFFKSFSSRQRGYFLPSRKLNTKKLLKTIKVNVIFRKTSLDTDDSSTHLDLILLLCVQNFHCT